MAKSPAFPLYVRDFLVDTQHFTPEEVGCYIRLLATQWVQPLPSDIEDLARIAGMPLRSFRRAWTRVLVEKFDPAGENVVANPRLEDVRREQEANRVRKSEAGHAGAEARWQSHQSEDGSRNATAPATAMAKPCPAVAVAVAVGTTLPPAGEMSEEERAIRDNLRPEYVTALDGILRSSPKPAGLARSIRALGPGGIHECVTWDILGRALHDLDAAPGTVTAAAVQAFALRLKAGDPPPRQLSGPRYGDARNAPPEPVKAITSEPPPREPTPEETLADLDAKLKAQSARKKAGNLGDSIALPRKKVA